MFVNIAFSQDPSATEALKVVKKMNLGKTPVYHVYSASQKTSFALKIFNKDAAGDKSFDKEKILFQLSHPNIIQHIPATVKVENDTHFNSIVTEFAKYGDVFDMVVAGILSSEILIRTYFHQVVAGLEYMHSQGFAHLDLKLENLLIGSDFTLKIIDFDQAQSIEEKKITSGGTTDYRAPEVIDGSSTNFQAADIYSLGIILFSMKAQNFPFAEVTTRSTDGRLDTSLRYYASFIKDNKSFWEKKAIQKNDPEFYNADFKELINGMLQYDISKRFTLNEVKNSKWFKGPVLSSAKLKSEMRARCQLLRQKETNFD